MSNLSCVSPILEDLICFLTLSTCIAHAIVLNQEIVWLCYQLSLKLHKILFSVNIKLLLTDCQ